MVKPCVLRGSSFCFCFLFFFIKKIKSNVRLEKEIVKLKKKNLLMFKRLSLDKGLKKKIPNKYNFGPNKIS